MTSNRIKRIVQSPVSMIFMAIVLLAVVVVLMQDKRNENLDVLVDVEIEELIQDEFGFPQDAYIVSRHIIRSGQTLSHILSGLNLSAAMIDQVAREMRELFDPRRMRSGQAYYAYYPMEQEDALAHFVYEISPLEFLKVSFKDTLLMDRVVREITYVTKHASGLIESSLWSTLSARELNPELAIRMSEVLAWEVDFYRIQKGDRFRVIYDESYVGERSVGVSRIRALFFEHFGRDILGFHFEADTISDYFNAEGDNLRKMFLKAPLEFGRITSRFSNSRLHPILNQRRPHYGTDYAAPHGTPILAVGDGVVTRAAYDGGNGNYVRIRHNSVYETQYLHMSRFAQGIKPGARVRQGQVIGYVGSTGLATGPHVCFRFWKNGQQVDHLREQFPSADALPWDYHQGFTQLRDSLIQVLASIPLPDPS